MFQEEEIAKTRIQVLEVVKKFLVKGAIEITLKQFHDGTWKIIAQG